VPHQGRSPFGGAVAQPVKTVPNPLVRGVNQRLHPLLGKPSRYALYLKKQRMTLRRTPNAERRTVIGER
jgi:hypothetical protein